MTKIKLAITLIGLAIFFSELQQSDATFAAACSTNPECNTPSETCDGSTCACSTGYVHDGNGVCDIVDCGNPTDPTYGAITTSSTTYQSTGTVTCDSGYTLSGSSPITCSSTGSWTTIPTCKANSGSTVRCRGGIYLIVLTIFVLLGQVYAGC